MSDENNNNQEPYTQNESETNNSSSNKKSSITESKGKWGKRKGDTYKFSKGIKSLNKTPVYPQLLYKKSQEKSDDNNKNIIILKLVGQDQTVEFYKDDLYKNFGRTIKRKGRGGRSHSIWCNDDEFQILTKIREKSPTSISGGMNRPLTILVYSDKLMMLQKVSLVRHGNLFVPLGERELTPVERM